MVIPLQEGPDSLGDIARAGAAFAVDVICNKAMVSIVV